MSKVENDCIPTRLGLRREQHERNELDDTFETIIEIQYSTKHTINQEEESISLCKL